MDEILSQQDAVEPRAQTVETDSAECLAKAAVESRCRGADRPTRTINIRLAVDARYLSLPEGWKRRLSQTLDCTNQVFAATGVQWRLSAIQKWDPGEDRHNLYALLHRLRHEWPHDGKSLAVGITVWDKRNVYRTAGGEIGLSQAGACVVPSWPRVENDCLILAHELGHLIGAIHVSGQGWIMGPSAKPFYLPSTMPLARVAATYRFHPRNRLAVEAYKSARFSAVGLRPTPVCQQYIRRIDACWPQ